MIKWQAISIPYLSPRLTQRKSQETIVKIGISCGFFKNSVKSPLFTSKAQGQP
ncbi:hypothetical protein [Wolinella succinogenes]|uniref:hypothetical protein n=1 Tax=Wolinella succinogenes TaxID=844 RepID=UPI002409E609|nr:hypothetical protein [Wolinella succinogenes]